MRVFEIEEQRWRLLRVKLGSQAFFREGNGKFYIKPVFKNIIPEQNKP